MASSDRPFKLVHANPRMVEDVVRLVAPQWVDRLDYEALVAVDKEYVARESPQRHLVRPSLALARLRVGFRWFGCG